MPCAWLLLTSAESRVEEGIISSTDFNEVTGSGSEGWVVLDHPPVLVVPGKEGFAVVMAGREVTGSEALNYLQLGGGGR